MQQPMCATPQALTLNPLKDAAIDYSADLTIYFLKWMILIKFSGIEKYLIRVRSHYILKT